MPTGLAFVGTRKNEEFLVLEKNTGRVRHFENEPRRAGDRPGRALDLARGHLRRARPDRHRAAPGASTAAPRTPRRREPRSRTGSTSPTTATSGRWRDGCGGSRDLPRGRFTWNGTSAREPRSRSSSKALAAGETTQVGGGIAIGLEIDSSKRTTSSTGSALRRDRQPRAQRLAPEQRGRRARPRRHQRAAAPRRRRRHHAGGQPVRRPRHRRRRRPRTATSPTASATAGPRSSIRARRRHLVRRSAATPAFDEINSVPAGTNGGYTRLQGL